MPAGSPQFIINSILMLFILFASPHAFCSSGKLEDGPLFKGTKIVPGDLKQDEFFIVAENNDHKVIKDLPKKITKSSKAMPVNIPSKIELALNQILENVFVKHNFKTKSSKQYSVDDKSLSKKAKFNKHTKKNIAYNKADD